VVGNEKGFIVDISPCVFDPPVRITGGGVQVDSIKTREYFESAPVVCNQRWKLKCDEPLSNFAFNFNVRRYTPAARRTC